MSTLNPRRKRAIFKRDGYHCQLCGGTVHSLQSWPPGVARHRNNIATIDHIVPVSQGGSGCRENLRTLCLACHRRVTHAMHTGGQA
jgi:5-methylcytosine-specific restriction endonuclease McrA